MSDSPNAPAGGDAVRDADRLAAVRRTGLLDTPAEEVFDRITRLAARAVDVPVTFLSLVDETRDFYKSCYGFGEPLASTRQLEGTTFCHYAIRSDQPLVIPDTRADPEYSRVPTVESLGVTAYLGVPLVTSEGQAIGSFCAIDFQPRDWTADQVEMMRELAAAALREIELRRALEEGERQAAALEEARRSAQQEEVRVTAILESITNAFFAVDREWRFTYVNAEAERLLQRPKEELLGRSLWEKFPEAVESNFFRHYRRAMERQETVEFTDHYPPLDLWVEVHVYPSAEGLSVYFQDVTEHHVLEVELRRSEARQRFLGEASALLASSLEYEPTLQRVATLAVPELADWCAVYLVDDEEGPITPVAIAHADSAQTDFAWELLRRFPQARDAPSGAARSIRTGEPDLLPEISDELLQRLARSPEHLDLLRQLRLRSFMAAPLNAHGRILGAVGFYSAREDRRYTPADLQMAEELARRAAVSIENARLVEAQQRGEQRYRSLVEASAAIVWNTPATGEFGGEQPRWTSFTGQSPEEYRGLGWLDVVHPDDRTATVQLWADALESRSMYQVEHRLRRRDGEWRAMLVRAIPILDEAGEVREWVGVHTDVTEQRRAQEALRASEERFRLMFQDSPLPMWVFDLESKRFLDVNRAAVEHYGYSREEFLAMTIADIRPPEQVPQLQQVFNPVQQGIVQQGQFRHRRKDGSLIDVEVSTQQIDVEGRPARITLAVDVTERRRVEHERERLLQALELERGRLENIFEHAPAAIAVSRGAEHRFISANPVYQQLVGRNVVGKTIREAFPELEGQGFYELLDAVYRTGEPHIGRETSARLDRDGDGTLETGYFNFVYQPLLDSDGAMLGVMTFAVEVTDQVLARQEVEARAEELARLAHALEITNRELDQFAYVASHDLKAPLRGIANLSNWIEEDLDGEMNPQVREHLELLRGRVHRMEGLIDGILQYSRAGRVREKPEVVEVGALLTEVVDLLAPPEHLQVRIDEGMPTLSTERLPLQQVFMNLVGNAIKYNSAPEPWVEVRAESDGEFYRFDVADNGPGIAPEYHDRIFGIFQTLAARDKVEGTGIGLSLVKKMVENRGGRVWLESQEGAGSVFRFTWPKEIRPET